MSTYSGSHAGAQTAAVWRQGSKLLHEAYPGSPDGRLGCRIVSSSHGSTSSPAPDLAAYGGTCALMQLALMQLHMAQHLHTAM